MHRLMFGGTKVLWALVVLLGLLVMSGCRSGGEVTIKRVGPVEVGGKVPVNKGIGVAAEVNNPENLPLIYQWITTRGVVRRSGESSPSGTYEAPGTPGTETIAVQVLSEGKVLAEKSFQMEVVLEPGLAVAGASSSPPAPTSAAAPPTVLASSETPASASTPVSTPTRPPLPATQAPASPSETKPSAAPVSPCPGGRVTGELQPMPFVVFEDVTFKDNHFCPSGKMGDVGDIAMTLGSVISVTYNFQGKGPNTCGYTPCKWAGVYWMNPEYPADPNTVWGSTPDSGYNLSAATKLRFRARSQTSAIVEFKVGGIATGAHPSSVRPPVSTGPVSLKSQWSEFEILLANRDLRYVIDGFLWVSDWGWNPSKTGIMFELDDIRFE